MSTPRQPRPEPIRILSLTFAEDSYQNAQQLNAREIARRLDPASFEVTLLSDGSGPASVLALSHVRALRLPRHGRALVILWALLFRRFDVLFHAHVGRPEALFLRLPRWWPSRRRARIVVPVEGDVAQLDEVPAWIRRRVLALYRRADAVVPITEHVASTLHARVGRTGPVVPVGVDLQRFRPGPRTPGGARLRLLCVGTLKAWKRPELARLAAEKMPEVDITWIGDGELLESQRAKAPPNLRFPGPIDHDRLPEAYRAADVLLHTSRMEGLPKVILEALACGLPIVAFSDYEPRFLDEARAGIVVDDADGMIAALRRLAEDPALRERMSAQARPLAERFAWERVTEQWAEVFARETAIAAGRQPPRA